MKQGFCVCLLFAWVAPSGAQIARDVNRDYATPQGRTRIAKSLEDRDRSDRLKLPQIVSTLGILPGSTVADVGTGVGMMLEYLSEAVGPAGRVIAEDIHQDFLDKARMRAKSEKLRNIGFVLGTERSPKLPERQIDLALALDVYHHFDYPGDMLGHIGRSLKPGGRVAIVDFYRHRRGANGEDMSKHIRADKDEVLREIQGFGYEIISQRDHGANQYILIFKRARQ